MFKIAIIGRPNTGKSTLFNALTGTRAALVHNRPGVTRDVVAGQLKSQITNHESQITIFDTAGLEKAKTGIAAQATGMALSAISAADAILFVVDGKTGLSPEDMEFAKGIRKKEKNKPVLLLMNKSESGKRLADTSEFYKLGFGAPTAISAEHKIGFDKIYEWIEELGKREKRKGNGDNTYPSSLFPLPHDCNSQLRIAIMGQPNVGKSTLVNKILGEDRVIVRDEPGVTRDTINIKTHALGRDFTLVDTAGLRRKAGITDDVETLAALKSLDALSKSDIVILMADATKDIENQALGIAGRVYDAGRILVLALNKWDMVPAEERDDKLLKLKHQFNNSFSQIIRPLILPISAETGTGVKNMLKRAFELWDISNVRAPSSLINRTVEKLVAAHQPPMSRLKRPMKIKFASQTREHPITITINVGGASDIPESYTRYLRRGIAKALKWEALPVAIEYKKAENPYEN
ncbi:MAG: ribosome biogenesis GTPase Der [Rickettsiales bacterium]|jgi:GTP-binding protein|nr:ribosome biogenesis GTPase Der [Rickettsiales bacterium]